MGVFRVWVLAPRRFGGSVAPRGCTPIVRFAWTASGVPCRTRETARPESWLTLGMIRL